MDFFDEEILEEDDFINYHSLVQQLQIIDPNFSYYFTPIQLQVFEFLNTLLTSNKKIKKCQCSVPPVQCIDMSSDNGESEKIKPTSGKPKPEWQEPGSETGSENR